MVSCSKLTNLLPIVFCMYLIYHQELLVIQKNFKVVIFSILHKLTTAGCRLVVVRMAAYIIAYSINKYTQLLHEATTQYRGIIPTPVLGERAFSVQKCK